MNFVQFLLEEAEAVSVPVKDFDDGPQPVAEDIKAAVTGVGPAMLACHDGQGIGSLAHVGVAKDEIDRAGAIRKHACPLWRMLAGAMATLSMAGLRVTSTGSLTITALPGVASVLLDPATQFVKVEYLRPLAAQKSLAGIVPLSQRLTIRMRALRV